MAPRPESRAGAIDQNIAAMNTVLAPSAANPLLRPWGTPNGVPPFANIRPEHFQPAFEIALAEHRRELDAIASSPAEPTFENTLVAFDRSGRLLTRIESTFDNLCSSDTSPALQAAERELAAPLAAHLNVIYMNRAMFKRIDSLHEKRASLGLAPEQLRLLERIHLDFVRAGARLTGQAQQRYGEIMEKLAELTTQFSQNVLADESTFRLILRTEADLAGLPDFVRAAARQAATERGVDDGHVITLSRSHMTPFLTFSDRRDLREQAFGMWVRRGELTVERNNLPVARAIMELRLEQATLQGYTNYADYALADTMAGRPQAVMDLLTQVWERGKIKMLVESEALKAMALSCGHEIEIEPWDWLYYAEKVRKARYDLDEAAVKPYFPLNRMVEAIFDCANRLFGLHFIEQPQIRAYHADVRVYEVRDAAGKLISLFMHDNFARASKRSGAWMSNFRMQCSALLPGENDVIPIVVNNNNFAKGAPGEPTLLSFDDARTLFHEFGHGLHGMLSRVPFERLAGTRVLRDFVELPSQLYEHWLSEPEVLKRHARHYLTDEAIPDELIDKLMASRRFNQGFEAVSYTASALLDIALHARTSMENLDLAEFERHELARIGMPRQTVMRHRLPHFLHLFAGSSYSAAYYVYLWAEVLDADAFDAFEEAGNPFDSDVAARLLKFIYSSGGTRPPMEAYAAFRGRAPTVEPMLRKKGLVDA
jgi:peptidyl-dipeptidase Dcp